ncbi:MAG: glycosyltransferase [Alphaproteobacteria bacterium]|nr:glycosyltransferase [Alphaproteobacteria bacterium]
MLGKTAIAASNRKIKVVYLARSLEATGGAEQQLARLVLGLDRSCFEPIVILFYRVGELINQLEAKGVRVEVLDKRGRWDLVRQVFSLVRLVRHFGADVVHSYLGPPNVASAMLYSLLGKSKVVWGLRASDMDLRLYDWTRRGTFALERMLSRIPDLIVVNSAAGGEYLLRAGFEPRRLEVIENGIDTQTFRNTPRGIELRERWLSGQGRFLIGLIARLDPMKDHENFLHAVRIASSMRSDVRFVCVGSGPSMLLAKYRTLASSLGVDRLITWVGEQQDMPAVYSACDLTTLSSAFGEGFPNVVAEALACERLSVSTNVGDAAAILLTYGIVVPPRDPTALALAWHKILDLDRSTKRNMEIRARDHIRRQFGVEPMVDRTERAYLNLLGRV